MTYLPGRNAAAPMVAAAIGMRMFWGMAVDFPFAMNASWLCPLLGLLIYLPLGFAINQVAKLGSGSVWTHLSEGVPAPIRHGLEGLFALVLLYDAAVAVRLLASSSNLIALNDVTVHLLIFPLAIVVAIVVLLGGDATGNSARIWIKLLPVFAVVMLFVQLKSYRTGWLTPVLGGGIGSILNGSIYCAGCLAMASLIWLPALPDRNRRGILVYAAAASVVVSLLMLTQHMSFPAMINIPFTRAARIELILSNGRMSLSPQLLLDILWFGSLLHLISAEVATAGVYLHLLWKKLPKWIEAILISAVVSIAAVYNPDWMMVSAEITRLLFPVIGGLIVSLMIFERLRKGMKKHAQI